MAAVWFAWGIFAGWRKIVELHLDYRKRTSSGLSKVGGYDANNGAASSPGPSSSEACGALIRYPPKQSQPSCNPVLPKLHLTFIFAQPLRAAPLRRPTPDYTESSYVTQNKLP